MTDSTGIIDSNTVHVRYLVDDVQAAIDFYTTHLGFTVNTAFLPAFADVYRGNLRLLLSGPASSAGRAMPDGRTPQPGGWNRIHLLVADIDAEVSRLRDAGVVLRSDVIAGPGGRQIVLDDPAGNPVELFQPAGT
jgi:catechol 2,3-dioxygenase-like lactoylglutathione lyase family enzyme